MHAEQSTDVVVRTCPSLRGSLATAGIALVCAGYLVGALSKPAEAAAGYDQPGGATYAGSGGGSSFGFAVPYGGFGVVADSTGHAWVVDCAGKATRVIYSTSGSAPDKPSRTEDQLPVR